jgi:nucleotide-binding universal stress UspA family protein
LQKDSEKRARRDLDAVFTEDDRQTLKLTPVVETHVNVANGVTAYAATNAIDLIIVGTHGRGVIKKFLMGSVAERVVRTAPCPVLAVREHERDFIAPDALAAAV